ncbi:MAG TPA: ATP-binding protein [Polyangiaceae bacterium]|nr:ATP-binding protein [Polyangiaceae bacterium]
MNPSDKVFEERVLVLMPSLRDTERTLQLLADASVACAGCADVLGLCRELRAGAGAVLLTDEIISADIDRRLESVLCEQPAWSALPILVLAREGTGERMQRGALGAYNSVIIVERPVRTRSLVSAVQSALRARRNQYEIREAIREHERQAAELTAQDEKLRFALYAGRLGSWELDLATQELVCSDTCKASYGRPLDEPFTYAQLHESIHPDDRERVRAAIDQCLATQSLYDVEYRVIWPNGETHWAMVRGRAVYNAQLQPIRMAGVSLDVTERERLHEALQRSQAELAEQADQLRTADRRKDEFLATLAHELRNPLAPITTGLSLLTGSSDPEVAQRTLGVMQRQVRHMVRLIDDLLDVSRITMGKLELKRERVTVVSIVESAIEGSLPNLQRGQHKLCLDVTDEQLFLDADHTRIAQVVSNLLNNASKYTADEGTIELSARRDDDHVRIEVRDNGLGFPKECLEDIFQMFGQVNRALDRSHGGLGIGLALVRKLVEMHGGTVDAYSAGTNQGSTFTVRLPLAAGSLAQVDKIANFVPPRPAEKRVLVVDDNDDAAELLALMLQQGGYKTTIAHDGAEALDAAHTMTPDLVILDIGLPGISGYEVAEQLRADASLSEVALIALTGWGTPEDRRRALAAGFDVHLTKPVTAEDLHDALGRALLLRQRGAIAG